MKILHLLFAVVFLVLLDAPGFSEARISPWKCRRRGGKCYLRCPTNSIYIAKCLVGAKCCQRQEFD